MARRSRNAEQVPLLFSVPLEPASPPVAEAAPAPAPSPVALASIESDIAKRMAAIDEAKASGALHVAIVARGTDGWCDIPDATYGLTRCYDGTYLMVEAAKAPKAKPAKAPKPAKVARVTREVRLADLRQGERAEAIRALVFGDGTSPAEVAKFFGYKNGGPVNIAIGPTAQRDRLAAEWRAAKK